MICLYFGKTLSGKSYKANLNSKMSKRVVIYDNAHCFTDGQIITNFSAENFAKIFAQNVNKEEFRLIFRPPFEIAPREGAERVARLLYFGFGRYWKENHINIRENVFFLVDEADKVSSLKIGSIFYLIVTKGRHFFIDTHAITQGPGKIPSYYRENAESFYCFKSKSHAYLEENLEKEHINTLRTIEEHNCIFWNDKGEIKHINKHGKVVKKWK